MRELVGEELCPCCKIHWVGGGELCPRCKNIKGGYVHLAKTWGVMSTYTKMSRGNLSGGYCLYPLLLPSSQFAYFETVHFHFHYM